jgi:mannosyltransferase OCH1-like enzyme
MIPHTIHFAFWSSDTATVWSDLNTLCIKSCLINSRPKSIIVHLNRDSSGAAWDEFRLLENVSLRYVNADPTVDQRIWPDIYRLRTLLAEGGFFSDLDFIFLKSFESLRDGPAVIGTQCKQKRKLACCLMGCEPGADFIAAYLKAYDDWTPETLSEYANTLPWTLSETHKVNVLSRSVFYALSWTNLKFWKGKSICLKTAVAVHLWNNRYPDITRTSLDQTILKPILERLDLGGLATAVSKQPGRVVSFD